MTNLRPIPKDRDWSPETWRAGLDEAVRLVGWPSIKTYAIFDEQFAPHGHEKTIIITLATTLLDAGIVKHVVSEGVDIWASTFAIFGRHDDASRILRGDLSKNDLAAIAVIDAALAKARAGG